MKKSSSPPNKNFMDMIKNPEKYSNIERGLGYFNSESKFTESVMIEKPKSNNQVNQKQNFDLFGENKIYWCRKWAVVKLYLFFRRSLYFNQNFFIYDFLLKFNNNSNQNIKPNKISNP